MLAAGSDRLCGTLSSAASGPLFGWDVDAQSSSASTAGSVACGWPIDARDTRN
jgi:hypothetical protein